jgi:Spy/CpxP family protein refolding chaperone
MGEGGPEGAAMGEGGEGGSEPSGQLRAWQEKLGLSDDQVARIKAVRAAHRRASRELAGKVRRDVQNLRDMVESGSSDSELSAAISTLKQDREAQRREREALSDDLGAVFTPAQDARYILEMSGRQESPGGMGRKGGAGAGGLP